MKEGHGGERKVVELFNKASIDACQLDGHLSDVLLKVGEVNYVVEVKYDKKSDETGNIAVEFYNTRSMQPSGIMATTANFWAVVLPDDTVYLTSTKQLRTFFDDNVGRDFFNAGDGNAAIRVYPKSKILDAIFLRVDHLNRDTLLCAIDYLARQ